MSDQIRFSFDRRSGEDRRKAHTDGYFLERGIERRTGKDRRHQKERRKAWIRISPFLMKRSMAIDDEGDDVQKTI
jgi:hypothetical protein